MSLAIEFTCSTCGQRHEGIPTFGWDHPIQVLDIPEEEREQRVALGTDDCIIDNEHFFVRGCLEIPVTGHDEPFTWGVWVSLSQENYERLRELFNSNERQNEPAYFGWLCAVLPGYPDTLFLKTLVHLRPKPNRPFIELEPTDHPLSIEQRKGITMERVREIYETITHTKD
jgi:hypothetical protein